MLKITSLASVISLRELLTNTQLIISSTFRFAELYAAVGLWYLVLVSIFMIIHAVERRLRMDQEGDDPAAQRGDATPATRWRRRHPRPAAAHEHQAEAGGAPRRASPAPAAPTCVGRLLDASALHKPSAAGRGLCPPEYILDVHKRYGQGQEVLRGAEPSASAGAT